MDATFTGHAVSDEGPEDVATDGSVRCEDDARDDNTAVEGDATGDREQHDRGTTNALDEEDRLARSSAFWKLLMKADEIATVRTAGIVNSDANRTLLISRETREMHENFGSDPACRLRHRLARPCECQLRWRNRTDCRRQNTANGHEPSFILTPSFTGGFLEFVFLSMCFGIPL